MSSGFFVSRRKRHTSCALVTGVQTCALPISVCHHPALAIEDPPGEQAGLLRPDAPGCSRGAGLELVLHGLPQRSRHNRWMLAGKMFALVDDVANIDAVREQVIKRAAAEDRKSTRLNSSH